MIPVAFAPRLREQEDVALLGGRLGVEGEAGTGGVEAHAVGADQPHPGGPRALDELALLLDQLLLAGLGEPGREEVQRAHAALDAVLDELLARPRTGSARSRGRAGSGHSRTEVVAGDAADLGHLRVDGIEGVVAVVAPARAAR